MAKVTGAKQNFTAGELSPRLAGRTDLGRYDNGVKTLQNFLVQPHGGVTRRPGTRFVKEIKTSANKTRLIPFEFNVDQAYVLELGHQYMRFYKDGGIIVSSGTTPYEISTPYGTSDLDQVKFAQTADVMYMVHPSYSVRKLTRTDHNAWTLTEVDLKWGAFQDPNSDTTNYMTASAHTGSGVTLTAAQDTFASTDVGRLVKVYDGYAKITAYTSATVVTATVQPRLDSTMDAADASLAPTYTASTISAHEGDPDSTGLEHNDRFEDSAGNFIKKGFRVGHIIKGASFGDAANNATGKLIVAVTANVITLAPGNDLVSDGAGNSRTLQFDLTNASNNDYNFALGAFHSGSYPRTVNFYEQRLVFGGTANAPQTLWFSQSGDYENFKTGTANTDGLVYTIGSSQVNVIRYLSSGTQLVVGTSGGEFVVRASGIDEPLTPINTQIKQQTTYGSADIQALQIANATLFVQRAKRKVRELVYNSDVASFTAPDMTILAEHITENGVSAMAYQQEPDSVVWGVRADGQLIGMTYRREEQVVAWHRHIIGGVSGDCTITVTDYSNIATNATLVFTKSDGNTVTFTCQGAGTGTPATNKFFHNESNNTTADNIYTAINAHADFTVANPAANVVTVYETNRAGTGFLSVESSDTTRMATTDQSHAVVESVTTIPGDLDEDQVWLIVKRTIGGATKRYVEYMKDFDFGTDINNAFFVDSGLSYSGSSTSTFSGLDHIDGEAVAILGNGSAQTNKLVSSNAISLDAAVTKACVGLPFNSYVETLRPDLGSEQGSAQGKVKRIMEVTARFYRTVGMKVGTDLNNLDTLSFRTSGMAQNEAVPMFTGDKTIEFNGGFDDDGTLVIKQDQALPMTLLAVFPSIAVYDK